MLSHCVSNGESCEIFLRFLIAMAGNEAGKKNKGSSMYFMLRSTTIFTKAKRLLTSCEFLSQVLKWYYDQKIISFFSSDFESVFAKHPTGKILSFVLYPKAVYFECKFWISRSAITHVQN